jgi:hypothetical protein
MLTVTADGLMVYQTYQGYATNGTYERKYYDGTWEAWQLIWDSGIFANNSANWNTAYTVANAALPKAGGTMTGALNMGANQITNAGVISGASYNVGSTPVIDASRNLTAAIGVFSGSLRRTANNVGHLEGSYDNVAPNNLNSNPIYTIGSSYNPASTTLSNMYGIGYTNASASFISMSGASGWGMYVASDGDARVYLSGQTGGIAATGNITAYASDARLKTNIKPIENALEKLNKIRGVEYDWVDNITSEYDFHPSIMHETGVIAQEIQEAIPDAVTEAPMNANYTAKCGTDHKFLTVQKDKIVPLLIEAVKEQQKEIDELKSLVKQLLEK